MTALDLATAPPRVAPPPRLNVALRDAEQPVELAELHVSVEASGALAITTWELTFFNPNQRVLEGQLEFPLLEGQTVVRFAMEVEGALREAVPVPKPKARQVFEEIVRRQVDPGLLEKTAGNSYRARVYPLLPGEPKRVVLAYQEELGARGGPAAYRLALDFAALRRFSLEFALGAAGAGASVTHDTLGLTLPPRRPGVPGRIERTNFSPRGALELTLPAVEGPAVATQEFEGELYFRAEQALPLRTRPRPAPRVLGLLWDSSGSGAGRDLGRELATLDLYLRALPGPIEVRLVRLRDEAEPVEAFRVEGGDWSALRRALEATRFDGATSLRGLRPEPGVDAWLFFGDGLVTFGDPAADPNAGAAPVHTLLSATRADPARLRALADQSGGEFVNLLELAPEAAVARLLHATERLLAVEVSPLEAVQVFPRAPSPLRSSRLVLAGMLRAEQAALRARVGFADAPDDARLVEITVRAGEGRGRLAARAWAALKIEELEPLYERNRDDIEWTGQAFGIVTRSTSLVVLDSVEDYARYDIAPPEPLRPAWERLRKGQWRTQDERRAERLEAVARLFRDYVAWWESDFPKAPERATTAPSAGDGDDDMITPVVSPSLRVRAMFRSSPSFGSQPPPAPPPAMPARALSSAGGSRGGLPFLAEVDDLDAPTMAEVGDLDDRTMDQEAADLVLASHAPASDAEIEELSDDDLLLEEDEPEGSQPPAARAKAKVAIQLQKWTPDASYLERFARTPAEGLYAAYLDERPAHARSTAFFLDAADVFFERGLPDLGLRVLSNLAEMELENHAVLRILGYRLLQAGRPDLARPVFEQVKALRPEEPQSLRDLAQACAALGDRQRAVDLLWEVVTGAWDARFPGIELIALIELNALAATSPEPLDLSRVDPRLVRALPLDLRAVLTWDADNTDIDLWVTDPLGEKAYFGNTLTRQGGRMSPDFREGYGPEEFSLREAVPGEYKIEANFYGNTQQIIAGATTIQLQLITRFATPEAEERRVTLRLREARDVVLVGKFTVEGPGGAGRGA
ncbi:MAG TPA: VIT domain-containing protein [Polyangiaceae bacterium]|nr:VIT domain-containing protein [Polyangiaceae bacterium]